ncbi:11554_t:CDS:2 [Dentiscutata erythropus]|uniref:11554_t:CDS:1 n=1 Tax=Dentiscutata erythropus TaxID=1348616 RepID=A0A9N9IAT3_9GLOM|nr:11554_t:CDS:2 [Dentiscutata erythropus]
MFKTITGAIFKSSLAVFPTRTSLLALSNISQRGYACKTIYLSNVPYTSNEQGLEELGSRYGKVESVRLPRDYEGRSRGYGFIEFSQEEEAARAMEELNGFQFEGRELRVAEARGGSNGPRGGGGFGGSSRGGFGGRFVDNDRFDRFDRGGH